MAAPPAKRQRFSKFSDEYTKTWDFVRPSKLGDEYARCTICDIDIKISSGARTDLERHIKTVKHANRAKAQTSTPSLTSMFRPKPKSSIDEQVTKAELLFVNFIIEHNLPIAIADHAEQLFQKMFPDSEIAKRFKCARTKTRQLITDISEDTKLSIVEHLKEKPFSLSTDGSNDRGSEQIYPVFVKYHNEQQVVSDVLSITTPTGNSTGENIFNALDQELLDHGLSWNNCISFSSDNASVMLGKANGVAAHILKKNPDIYIKGGPCHLLHIAAKKAAQALHCPKEEALIDIYYYLDNSTKRQKSLQYFQLETGSAVRKILKHGPTRWLSLQNSVNRLIDQWDALDSFISQEMLDVKAPNDRLKRIDAFFKNKSSKLYALFVSFALPTFINANLLLQREEPTIHLLQERIHDQVTDIMVAFVKPEAITRCSNIFEIEHHRRSKQKDREDLVIGEETRKYLEEAKSSSCLSGTQISTFFDDVRKFYSASLSYIFQNLPLQDDALKHALVLDPKHRLKASFSSIRFWCSKFQCLIPADGMESLQKEFAKFQIDCLDGINVDQRVDRFWQDISRAYPALSKLMKGLCSLPHSYADCEGVFSLVRKNKTEARASMSRKLLSEILIMKMKLISRGEVCHHYLPSKRLLTKTIRHK